MIILVQSFNVILIYIDLIVTCIEHFKGVQKMRTSVFLPLKHHHHHPMQDLLISSFQTHTNI